MFVNIRAFRSGSLIYEANPYDYGVGTMKGLSASYSPNSPALGPNEVHLDNLVYEMHPTSTITGEDETFHFVLATGRYKDNRIPPKGFRIAEANARLTVPAWHGALDPNYFTTAEYTGGYDEVAMNIASGADAVQVRLFYQTTSREYIEFLRDEINGNGRQTLPPSAYVAQFDPFFAKLKAWGNTIWQLWDRNKDVPGAAPFEMTSASVNVTPCAPPVPELQYLQPGDSIIALTWSNVHASDPNVIGYRVYYDQAGKAQFVGQVGLQTNYTDTGLVVGQTHCYKVTSVYASCESAYSNVLCALPAPLVSLGEAKSLPPNSWVYVDDVVVTAATSLGWGAAYVESPTRACGFRLLATQPLTTGHRVRFTGQTSYVDGEWQISEISLLHSEFAGLLRPLLMPNRSIANDPSLWRDTIGVDTAGLLVQTTGRVTQRIDGGNVMYIDDGSNTWDALSGASGLRVQMPAGSTLPALGSYAKITGISRVEKQVLADWRLVNGQWYAPGTAIYVPVVWVRQPEDVTVY